MSEPVTISTFKEETDPLTLALERLLPVSPLLPKQSFFSFFSTPELKEYFLSENARFKSLLSKHLQTCTDKIIQDQNIILDKIKIHEEYLELLEKNLDKIRKCQLFLPRELQLQNLQNKFPTLVQRLH
jgi:hypothetical protein